MSMLTTGTSPSYLNSERPFPGLAMTAANPMGSELEC